MRKTNEVSVRSRARTGRATGRAAAVVLIGLTVVAVSAVGYYALSAATPAGTSGSTTHGCEPASSPVCQGANSTTFQGFSRAGGGALVASR